MRFEALIMPSWMESFRCPKCNGNIPVGEKKAGDSFILWSCGTCYHPMWKELIDYRKWWQRLLGLKKQFKEVRGGRPK